MQAKSTLCQIPWNQLNPQQREAVGVLSGPLLVLAGAGTGKTRVVTYRVANLIAHRVPPRRILAVTFTRKAAGEMLARVRRLLRLPKDQGPVVGTFHSLCLDILRRHAQHLGYPKHFVVYDRSDQLSVIRTVLREVVTSGPSFRPADLAAWFSTWKAQGLWPQDASARASDPRTELAAVVYRRYQQALRLAGAVDFDDLLLLVLKLFDEHPAVLQQERNRFEHILIDEYQDTNPPQYRIIRLLAQGHCNLCAVGDDDQSIYRWRGARVEHILQFQRDWPQARIIRLEENYRSTQPILDLANRVIGFNRHRHAKQLRSARGSGPRPRIVAFADPEEEAQAIVSQIAAAVRSRQARPGDFAILFRTNDQIRPFEAQLRQLGLSYTVVGSTSFFDRKEVRDLMAFLQLALPPVNDVALLRVINVPPRGIGTQSVEWLLEQSVQQNRRIWSVMTDSQLLAQLPPRTQKALGEFVRWVEALQARARRRKPSQVLSWIVDTVQYEQEIARVSRTPEEQQGRQMAVQGLLETAAAYEAQEPRPSLRRFLDQMAVEDRTFAKPGQNFSPDEVVLITLHGAKGLEFSRVYLVGVEEGLLPHRHSIAEGQAAVEEERRLFYVGITRAQDVLTLSYCRHRPYRGRKKPCVPSRFLYEAAGQAQLAQQAAAHATQQWNQETPSAEKP